MKEEIIEEMMYKKEIAKKYCGLITVTVIQVISLKVKKEQPGKMIYHIKYPSFIKSLLQI